MRVASEIELTHTQRDHLIGITGSQTAEVRLVRRASIVLLCADGLDNKTVGEILGIDRIQVGRWRDRYAIGGMAGISKDLPRGGRPARIDAGQIVARTTQSLPEAATQWSSRTMASSFGGVSYSTVSRIWKKHGLKPHRVARFKVSRDPRFVEKLEDVMGP